MNLTKESIKEYCEQRGYHNRACRFKVIENLLGISPEEAKQVEKITRYIRYAFPPDETSFPNQKEVLKDLDYAPIHFFANGKLL